MITEKLVPLMNRFKIFRMLVKKVVGNRSVDWASAPSG